MATILLVEDDQALAMGIEYALREEGYDVRIAGDCRSARHLCVSGDQKNKDIFRFEAVLLDVMLPDGTGYDLLQSFREEGITSPVIFLTAVSDEGNVVRGLDLGADDYITKPFRIRELMSRLRAVLRRSQMQGDFPKHEEAVIIEKNNVRDEMNGKVTGESDTVLCIRNLVLDTERAEAWLISDDEKIVLNLTKSEYRLLHFLMKNRGRTLNRSLILERLFDDGSNYVDDNTLSVYINRLREKIGDPGRKEPFIQTVRGIGYRFSAE